MARSAGAPSRWYGGQRCVLERSREVDVCYTGFAEKPTAPCHCGCSLGHFDITSETRGAFARRRSDGLPVLLSNNHVLAIETRGSTSDTILHLGVMLVEFNRLKHVVDNLMDASTATLSKDFKSDSTKLTG
jgi:hypothetical protein